LKEPEGLKGGSLEEVETLQCMIEVLVLISCFSHILAEKIFIYLCSVNT